MFVYGDIYFLHEERLKFTEKTNYYILSIRIKKYVKYIENL